MQPDQYPPQDKVSEFAKSYAAEVMRRDSRIKAEDILLGKNPYQSVGIHKPLNPCGPVFMFIHGGGWTTGYKEWNNFMAPTFTDYGVIFVTVGYRLAPVHLFPAGLEDCASAVAWIYNNISELGGDPKRIFLGGHSAGGHFSSLLAVQKHWQGDFNVPENVIQGCVPVSGVYRFGEGSGLSQRPRFLGEKGSGTATLASPVLQTNSVTPPFLMAHGDNDFPHLISQAEEMEAVLHKFGSSVERIILKDCDHLGAHLATGEANGEWIKKVMKFMAV